MDRLALENPAVANPEKLPELHHDAIYKSERKEEEVKRQDELKEIERIMSASRLGTSNVLETSVSL